jgi:hypothetical protein
MLPDYDKAAARERADLRNHAVDAIVLGCDLPSASALENRQWNLRVGDVRGWLDRVRAAAPETLQGLPRVAEVEFVPNFEQDLDGGYCAIELSAFNWNRRRKATHALDPFGITKSGLPLKRKPAAAVLAALADPTQRGKQIEAVANAGLRRVLSQDPDGAAVQFVRWLQGTVRAGLRQGTTSNHPADVARRQLLERFVSADAERVATGEEAIPPTIGVRCVAAGSQNKLDVVRVDRKGVAFQRYQSQPTVRELRVGYRLRGGGPDRSHPVLFFVSQCFEVRRQGAGGKRATVAVPADNPLRGRPHGSREPLTAFLSRWQEAFGRLCQSEGIDPVFVITQGCVIEKMDGARFQFCNFEKGSEWMKSASFRDIRRVYRSPLQAR